MFIAVAASEYFKDAQTKFNVGDKVHQISKDRDGVIIMVRLPNFYAVRYTYGNQAPVVGEDDYELIERSKLPLHYRLGDVVRLRLSDQKVSDTRHQIICIKLEVNEVSYIVDLLSEETDTGTLERNPNWGDGPLSLQVVLEDQIAKDSEYKYFKDAQTAEPEFGLGDAVRPADERDGSKRIPTYVWKVRLDPVTSQYEYQYYTPYEALSRRKFIESSDVKMVYVGPPPQDAAQPKFAIGQSVKSTLKGYTSTYKVVDQHYVGTFNILSYELVDEVDSKRHFLAESFLTDDLSYVIPVPPESRLRVIPGTPSIGDTAYDTSSGEEVRVVELRLSGEIRVVTTYKGRTNREYQVDPNQLKLIARGGLEPKFNLGQPVRRLRRRTGNGVPVNVLPDDGSWRINRIWVDSGVYYYGNGETEPDPVDTNLIYYVISPFDDPSEKALTDAREEDLTLDHAAIENERYFPKDARVKFTLAKN